MAQVAYWTGFQSAVERSYGFWKVVPEYTSPSSFLQHLRIVRVPNPDSILMDPDYQEFDGSDMKGCFEQAWVPKTLFAERYPGARKKSFTADDMKEQPDWLTQHSILTVAYWKVLVQVQKVYLVDDGEGKEPRSVWEAQMTASTADRKRILKDEDRKRAGA